MLFPLGSFVVLLFKLYYGSFGCPCLTRVQYNFLSSDDLVVLFFPQLFQDLLLQCSLLLNAIQCELDKEKDCVLKKEALMHALRLTNKNNYPSLISAQIITLKLSFSQTVCVIPAGSIISLFLLYFRLLIPFLFPWHNKHLPVSQLSLFITTAPFFSPNII